METVRIKTDGMHCQSCSMLIEMNVGDLPGVETAEVSLAEGMTVVTFDASQLDANTIAEEIRKAGYQAEIVA